MKIAICDDSLRDREGLRDILLSTELGNDCDYSLFSSGEALLTALESSFFDIIFLDVDMPELNGIDTGKLIRQKRENVIIIFLTSHPEFALHAFECEAFHYLLKPCDKEKLGEVMTRAASRIGLLHRYHVVKTKNGSVRLSVSDIYYIECLDRHVIYHMKDEDIITRAKLSEVCDALQDLGFCRVHQGFAVNMDKIKNIEKDSVILTDGRNVMMSVRKKAEVSLAYMKYVEKFAR